MTRRPRRLKPVHTKQGPLITLLVAERISQGVLLKDLAEKTGWSLSAIWNFENGRRAAPFQYVVDAAQVLGMEVKMEKVDDLRRTHPVDPADRAAVPP